MLKHIGRHGDRKVAILFREVPGEDHMCLVIYPDTLPTHIHNSIMGTLESAPGQAATNLSEVLHRNLLPDGRPQLEALHKEGMIKKVPTAQIIVTPTLQSSVKLDELNKIIREMESGEQALKRLQDIDKNSGYVDPAQKRKAEAEYKRSQEKTQNSTPVPALNASQNSALDDQSIAANMLAQAKRMEVDARSMINEAARMKKDAQRLFPSVDAGAPLENRPTKVTEPSKRSGRPAKASKEQAETTNAVQ